MSDALTSDTLVEAFEYLDDLRESGVTNMFGASSYLADALAWDDGEARAATKLWMRTFDGKSSIDARVTVALLEQES